MTRSTFALLLVSLALSGCATLPRDHATSTDPTPDGEAAAAKPPEAAAAHEGQGVAPFATRVVQVDVTVGLLVVSSGLGYWLDHGVVLTSLHAVNSVPPNGGLVIRSGGQSFNASTWVGGNRTDLDAAILYVHDREQQGPLPPGLAPCADGIVATPDDRLLTLEGELPVPTRMDPALSGAAVYSPSGDCRLGLLAPDVRDPTVPRVTPISAQALLEKSLPGE